MKMKKALAAVLTTSIAVSAVPMTAWAEEGAQDEPKVVDDAAESTDGETPAGGSNVPATPLELATMVDEDRLLETVETPVDGTVKLTEDTIYQTLDADKIYDLNGFTLTYTGRTVEPKSGQTLKFIDSTGNKSKLILRNESFGVTTAYLAPKAGGSVIAEGITIECNASVFFPAGDAARVIVDDCDVKTTGVYCVGTNAGKADNYDVEITLKDSTFVADSKDGDNCTVMINVGGTLNIDNCDITGDRQAVVVRAGTATIKNSTLTVTGTFEDHDKYHSGKWGSGNEVPSSALTVGNYVDGTTESYTADAVVTVKDTKVESKNEEVPAIYTDANKSYDADVKIEGNKTEVVGAVMKGQNKDAEGVTTDITVSDGKFSEKIDPTFLAKGLNYEAEDNGTFTYHKTLKDAQEAGGTVTQVKNPETGEAIKPGVTEMYEVTIKPNNGDNDTKLEVPKGSKINVGDLDTPVKSRYKFRGWAVEGKYVSEVVVNEKGIEIEAQWKKKSSSSSSSSSTDKEYSIAIDKDIDNGKVKVDPSKAEKGDKVTITVTPDKGYEISKVVVKDADGEKLEVKDKGKGEYTFTMPDSKVEIDAKFVKAEEEKPEVPAEAKTIVLTIDQKIVNVSGEYVVNDVAPIIRNERTMLPIRFVAKELGAEVAWDDALNKVTITKDDLKIELIIGSAIAVVNGENVTLDAPAFIENSRTYLPLRFVAENLGATVTWDAATQQVTIVAGK